MTTIAAAFRIIWNTFVYRVRMREANNLAVTLSMMVAFHLPLRDVLYRSGYALLLNMFAYLINDYHDIALDLASPNKKQDHVQWLATHQNAARWALLGLSLLLLLGGFAHSWLLLLAFVSSTLVVYLYSAWLKGVPVVDLLLMAVAGATGTMIGISANHPLGWKLLGLLSLFSCSYELIQIIRDEPDDRNNDIRTTAVFLGVRWTAWLYRCVMVAAILYGLLVIGSYLPLSLLAAAVVPLSVEKAARSWDMVRLVFGAIWIGLMVQLYLGYL